MKDMEHVKKNKQKIAVVILLSSVILSAALGLLISFFVTKSVLTKDSPQPVEASFTTQTHWYDENGTYFTVYDDKTGIVHAVFISTENISIAPLYDAEGKIQIIKPKEE